MCKPSVLQISLTSCTCPGQNLDINWILNPRFADKNEGKFIQTNFINIIINKIIFACTLPLQNYVGKFPQDLINSDMSGLFINEPLVLFLSVKSVAVAEVLSSINGKA